MRLVSFSIADPPEFHLGLVRDDEVVDVELAGLALQHALPNQMLDLIENYKRYQQGLQAILDETGAGRFTHVQAFTSISAAHALRIVTLAAPIPRPRKNVLCVAVNYSEHAKKTATVRQRGAEAPTVPIFFTKAPTTLNAPFGEITIDPQVSTEIDWEVELGVIIGKKGKNIREEDALAHVFGYTVLNDVTARDLQAQHKQYFKGKSLDGSCPMGPYIVTADEIADPQNLSLHLRVNDITKQASNTSQMIFSIATIIAVLSRGMTLEPGDIIATGTPSGVGFTRVPPEFLQPGDVMESAIEGIGILRNAVVGIQQ